MSVNRYYDPYWDRYSGNTAHRQKGYTQVLAIPGRAEQAAEFNEAQSILRDYLERLGKAWFKEGQILSGCTVTRSGNTITISQGKIFLDGLVREVSETTLNVSGSGTEQVVASIETTVVSADNDPSLRDPALGADNYNLVGADREQQKVVFSVIEGTDTSSTPYSSSGSNTTIDTSTAAVMYGMEDGEVVDSSSTTDTSDSDTTESYLDDLLAERTYDENGNYKVSGLNLQSSAELDSNDKIKLYISSGRAYIRGYQVVKSAMSNVRLDRSTETRFVQSESHFYRSTQSVYQLTNGPIAQMNNFTSLVTVSGERKYRGTVRGGMDSLNRTPVDSITEVWSLDSQGNKVVYRHGVDYTLYADCVDWSLTGDDAREPESGVTYYVTYVYNRSMVEGTDFELSNDLDTAYVTILDNGAKPDHNTRMYFSYNYTLARRDLILMDTAGRISVMQGKPDRYASLITPYNGSDYYHELGYVNVFAKPAIGDDDPDHIAEIVNYDQTRLTQDNFNTMLKRIDALEDSIAQLDMEREIETGEDTTSLKGYFTDSFRSIDKSDLGYEDDEVSYTAGLDYSQGELTTQATILSNDLTINGGASSAYNVFGTVISAPYTLDLVVRQKYATGTMNVNPYASYGPLCVVALTPNQDNWVDEETLRVTNVIEQRSYTTSTRVYNHGYWSVKATKNLRNYLRTETYSSTTKTGTTVSRYQTTSVAATLIEYMRQKTILVTGSAFGENSKNIYCLFNGIPVNLTASGTTAAGQTISVDGSFVTTVNANDNGYFTANFTVPEGVPCGEVEVKMICRAEDNSEGVETSGTAIYTARGTLLTTTITDNTVITQHYKVLMEVHNLYSNDPLAQSFMLSDTYDRNLVKIGLYFATKSTVRPAVLQVRNIVNGYPGDIVYAEVKIDPDQVNLPTDANTPVVTEVMLNQPVYCYAGQMYCFVVLSDSNLYSLYYAKMGDMILGTSQQMIVNPYATGVMFSSSNASTWTAHQDSDLKFDLYRSVYTGKGEIVFNDVSVSDVTGLMLDAAYEVAGDDSSSGGGRSSLSWYYQYVMTDQNNVLSDWLPLDTLVYRDLEGITSKVSLKAVIETDYSTSPFIDGDRVSLRSFVDDVNAVYISKHLTETEFDDEYQKLKISYQAAIPTGASHTVYYMDKADGDWVEVKEGTNVSLTMSAVSEEFSQYVWNIDKLNIMENDATSPGSKFFKLRIDLNTTIRYNRPRVRKLAVIFKYE